MGVFEDKLFFVEHGVASGALVLPGGDVGEVFVVTQRFAVRSLVFFAEMPPAGLLAIEGILAKQFTEFEEIGHPAGFFERLVERFAIAQDLHVLPELLPKCRYFSARVLESLSRPGHARVVPERSAQLPMIVINAVRPLDAEKLAHAVLDCLLGLFERRAFDRGHWFAQ